MYFGSALDVLLRDLVVPSGNNSDDEYWGFKRLELDTRPGAPIFLDPHYDSARSEGNYKTTLILEK